ncbi:hypothetical protein W97_01027 [Coniosporium apollinis CBS 100218]|uniref:N-acetylgalactosaminide beta-1,3-galactosyltransferase n=1 Tax=Coniosporium apollinis (strain CBS 100218) TaxID=1168221 RepID=R7YIS2_CONA1|nr:uncharacterized protein W97_01027 [Coniosporium apollinis CBS 100218]EON61810.1 hypothetical protein W97_01027 [Coniosporium apollinis CBS 100218]
MLPFLSSTHSLRNLIGGIVILYIVISSYHLTKTWRHPTRPDLTFKQDSSIDCAPFPSPPNLVLSVKTGATEAYDKLPTQLLTTLRCAPSPLIFSDLEQHLGPHHLVDVLASLPPSITDNNTDFDIYFKQKEYASAHRDIRPLSTLPDARADWRTAGHNAAWALDKYKFLPMVMAAWQSSPDQDWYLFTETDSYISWANLGRMLGQYDPATMLYLGNPVRLSAEVPERAFYMAHGGSGILLSGAAVRGFAKAFGDERIAERWHARAKDMWYGDFVLAAFLDEELDLQITPAWPMMSRETPRTAVYGRETWCEPVVVLHHVRPEEVSGVWDFEVSRWNDGVREAPLLHEGLFKAFVASEDLGARRDDWDNMSGERRFAVPLPPSANTSATEPDPVTSVEACGEACEIQEECLQYTFVAVNTTDIGTCWLSSVIRIGEAKPAEPVQDRAEIRSWHSGWIDRRIKRWVSEQSCDGVPLSWKGELPPQ